MLCLIILSLLAGANQNTQHTEEEQVEEEDACQKRKRAKAEPVMMTKEQEDDFAEWLLKNPHHFDMSVSTFLVFVFFIKKFNTTYCCL